MSEPLIPTRSEARAWVNTLFNARYAAKHYDPDRVVSPEDFATIIEAGRLAPSSMGLEPWHFIHLKNKEVIEAIQPYCWGGADKIGVASHLVLLLGRVSSDMEPGSAYLEYILDEVQHYPAEMKAARYERMRTFLNEDSDIADARQRFDWVGKQVYIALGQMMTAAAILGVDSTPIEGYHHAKVHEVLVNHQVYDPEHFRLVVMLSLGYSSRPPRPKTRAPMTEVYSEF